MMAVKVTLRFKATVNESVTWIGIGIVESFTTQMGKTVYAAKQIVDGNKCLLYIGFARPIYNFSN